ncbi:MAG: DedA family protein [Candidatus Saccharibacteria bacterium]
MQPILEAIYQFSTGYIEAWGYWGLVLGMALESACMPVPSEIVLPYGGYMVSKGILAYWWTVFACVAGGLFGSVTAYAIGFYGGRPFILKYGKYIFLDPDDLERADSLFERYGNAIVFWARLLPVVRTFISLPAGISRMNFTKFISYTIAGSVPWTILFVSIGVKLGQNWKRVRETLEQFDTLIVVVLVLAVLYWVYRKVTKHYSRAK